MEEIHTTLDEDESLDAAQKSRNKLTHRIFSIKISRSGLNVQFSKSGSMHEIDFEKAKLAPRNAVYGFSTAVADIGIKLSRKFGEDIRIENINPEARVEAFDNIVDDAWNFSQAFIGTSMTGDSFQRRELESKLETVVDTYGNTFNAKDLKLVKVSVEGVDYVMSVDSVSKTACLMFGPLALYVKTIKP